MKEKKYTKSQISKLEDELFNRKISRKRDAQIKRILRGYGWK